MFQIFRNPQVDWLGKRKIFTWISVALLILGAASAIGRQVVDGGTDAFNLGVDFRGGTIVTAKFRQRPSADDVRSALNNLGVTESVIQDSLDKEDELLIKIPLIEAPAGEGAAAANAGNQVDQGRATVKSALDTFGKEAEATLSLEEDQAAAYKIVGTDSVGPIAGEQLRTQALIATMLGLFGVMFFIAYRYDWTYAAGAVVAVFHDVLLALAFFSIFQWEVNLTVLAAFLTLVGYSVNDTIVIFDRIRENITNRRGEPLYKLTNDSINQTMSRNIVTNGLVFLSVLALVIFGGDVLRAFSIALLIGAVVGTYSTIAIASPIALWWQGKIGEAELKEVTVGDEPAKLASASRRSVTRRPVTR